MFGSLFRWMYEFVKEKVGILGILGGVLGLLLGLVLTVWGGIGLYEALGSVSALSHSALRVCLVIVACAIGGGIICQVTIWVGVLAGYVLKLVTSPFIALIRRLAQGRTVGGTSSWSRRNW